MPSDEAEHRALVLQAKASRALVGTAATPGYGEVSLVTTPTVWRATSEQKDRRRAVRRARGGSHAKNASGDNEARWQWQPTNRTV
ncbi:hypothetical protein C9I57_12485 [Trinickia symbiotica]|uniref:Uncharacterized protein n=1 Tax=Trinickia symbiotica TaxID=863227 RepID=A0A2T3XVW4_9BURK|nr:hypothetical protein C9I57_12485 [Trinickia symbiotica]